MKKILMMFAMLAVAFTASAQKFALVDMEYILKNIPAYERANEQLTQVAKKWQAEVDALNTEAQTMYKNYQNEVVFLSQEQKKERQEAIMNKEKEASELKRKYFGPEGELFKKRHQSDDSDSGGNLQRGEGHCRPARIFAHTRPCVRHKHHFRLAEDRHKQRSAVEVGLF